MTLPTAALKRLLSLARALLPSALPQIAVIRRCDVNHVVRREGGNRRAAN